MGDRPLAVRCQSSLVLALEPTVPPGRRPHTGLDVWTARLQLYLGLDWHPKSNRVNPIEIHVKLASIQFNPNN